MLQEGRPVTLASRSLSRAEKNYVALELECLAIVFACQKFDQYIYGKKVRVETDHKLLETITRKSILAAPRRLQRMLLTLQHYNLDVVYHPGSQKVIADTLFRFLIEAGEEGRSSQQEVLNIAAMEEEAQELSIIKEQEFVRVKDQRLEEVQRAATIDPEQIALSQVIRHGWPTRIREVPATVQKYWRFRELLVIQDGVIYKGGQVVVPQVLREDYLRRLHSSHMGSESTLRRAKDAVYWPMMAGDIIRVTKQCPMCEEDSPARPRDKLLVHDIPKLPWAKVGMDLFTVNRERIPPHCGLFDRLFQSVGVTKHHSSNGGTCNQTAVCKA